MIVGLFFNLGYSTCMFKSFLQSKEWGEFQKSLGREVIFEPFVAIKHSLKRDFYYWYVPRIAGVESNKLQVTSADNEKCVFIRVEPLDVDGIPKGARKVRNVQPGKTLVLDLGKSETQLLVEMHNKTRYNIRVAQKHGVRVESMKDINAGCELIAATAGRQGYKDYGEDYYKKLIIFFSTLPDSALKASLLGAYYEDRLISCGLFIDYEGTRTYLFGGSSELHKNIMAPYLMHWTAIQEAKNEGAGEYDFWGIETASGETPGFVRFKLGFGGRQIEYPGAYDIVLRPVWYNVYKILRKINKLLN